jgi:hypothetical protein
MVVHLAVRALIFTTDYIQSALGNMKIYVHERFFNVIPKVLDQEFTVCVKNVNEFLQHLEMESRSEDLAS